MFSAVILGPFSFEPALRWALAVVLGAWGLYRVLSWWSSLKWSSVASFVESQSPFFRSSPAWRSELVSAAEFLEQEKTGDFEQAHIRRVAQALPAIKVQIYPRRRFWGLTLILLISILLAGNFAGSFRIPVPDVIRAWTPGDYEILYPYADATWIREAGALQGVRGSRVRFAPPQNSFLAFYLFLRSGEGKWSAIYCKDYCETQLVQSGQYAVGTLFSRSSLFPINVYDDEAPKSGLFAEVKGEWVPALVLEIFNQDTLPLEVVASDDLRIKNVEIIHRFQGTEDVIETFEPRNKYFKNKFSLSMSGWKGGEHEIFAKPSDDFQSSWSVPLKIVFNDENSLRQKRLEDLNSLIIEWTHVLADLIDSKLDKSLADGLITRLKSFSYPEAESGTLIAAYINELKALSLRIEDWAASGATMTRVDDLIARVEKQILYGLSLVFQERAGDLSSTSKDLAESQQDLAKMLEQIKDGKMKLDSKALEEAFKKVGDKLKELQEKISKLPQGPEDDMINREALEAQAQESEDLAKRIEDIRKQAESGDEKGALRELESLLNQLSILTKEMERGLDQWKNNLDQGAVQKAQEFAKKLDEIKKEETEINNKTKIVKEKMEKLDEDNKPVLSKKEAEDLKKLQDQMKQLKDQQKSTGEKFQQARKEFDTALEGTEWQQLFRSDEVKSIENQIQERLVESENGLQQRDLHQAETSQREAIDLINKAQQQQKQMQQQIQQMQKQESTTGSVRNERVEIKGNETKGEKERRRRIMESLKQQVGDKFQQSHERYFEELLQR